MSQDIEGVPHFGDIEGVPHFGEGLKPYLDTEAVVVGLRPGKGKYQGQMGALQVQTPEGRRFFIGTGFSDEQRRNPPPVGSSVTYRYRDLTRTGLPRFASFLRIYSAP